MQLVGSKTSPQLIKALQAGKLAVLRTDTLYGIVASANNQVAVKQIYSAKKRSANKPLIVLISQIEQLYDKLDKGLSDFWPGANSLILPSPSAPSWLVNDDGAVAYRLPEDETLRELIDQTGPLVAPSANIEGQIPAANITEAENYFNEQVSIYVDEGEVATGQSPSKLWQLQNDSWIQLR